MLNKFTYLPFVVILIVTTNSFAQDFGCYSAPSASGSVLDGAFMRESAHPETYFFEEFDWEKIKTTADTNGYYTEYYETLHPYEKKVKMEGNISQGKRNGLWKFYLLKEAYFISGNFTNGKKEGIWSAYYIGYIGGIADTSLSEIATFSNDVLNGEMKSYYYSGKISKITNFKDGLKHGRSIIYNFSEMNEPDKIYSEKNYIEGKLEGDYFEENYFSQQDSSNHNHYKNGKPHGVWTDYNWENKNVIEYNEGKIEGKLKKYHHNGTLMLEIEFKNNLPYNVFANNDSLGMPYDTCKFINGTGALCLYYPDGKLESYYNYENQILKGDFQRFFDDGSLKEDGNILYCKALKNYNYSPNDFGYEMNLNLTRGFSNLVIDKWHWYVKNEKDYRYSECTDSSQSGFYIDRIFDVFGKCRYQNTIYIDSAIYSSVYCNPLDTSMVSSRELLETLMIDGKKETIKQGLCFYYYPSGSLKAEINFENGKEKTGSKYYDDSGILIRTFVEDQSGSYSIYNADTVNRIDKDSLKQGKWIDIYKSSYQSDNCHDTPNSIRYYKDDKPVGVWKFYNSFSINNDLQSTKEWMSETLVYDKEYWLNKLTSEGYLNNNLKDGLWKFYNHKNDHLSATGLYFLGQKHGPSIVYKRNGKTIQSISYYEFDSLVYFSGKKTPVRRLRYWYW